MQKGAIQRGLARTLPDGKNAGAVIKSCMTGPSDLADQVRRLELMTTQTRLRLIESELALGLTFCMVLETEIRLGEIDTARRSIQNAHRTVEHVSRSMGNAVDMPSFEKRELRKRLTAVRNRLRAVDSKLARTAKSKYLKIVPWPLPTVYRHEVWS